MNMEKAIQKAIEGGWIPKGLSTKGRAVSWIKQAAINRSKFWERYCLDPLFWQALEKALGWKEGDYQNPNTNWYKSRWESEWVSNWHRFVDALAEGKTADEFFNSLLK